MIYLAAPLFNPRERDFNTSLKSLLGDNVYLPQEDGKLIFDLISNGMSIEMAVKTIHQNDTAALHKCTLMVAVLDGPHVDSGVAFEIGFFYSLRKPIIGFYSDCRSEMPIGHNPMIAGALNIVVASREELKSVVKTYL